MSKESFNQTNQQMDNQNDYSSPVNVLVYIGSGLLAVFNNAYGWVQTEIFHTHLVPASVAPGVLTLLNQVCTAGAVGFTGAFMGLLGKKVFAYVSKKFTGGVKKDQPADEKNAE